MAWTFSGVRDDLKARLDTVSGLRAYDTAPATIAVPADGRGAAIIVPAPGECVTYSRTLDGCDDIALLITVLAGKISERASQNAMDAYIDPTGARSILAAVDSGVGASWEYAVVTSARDYGAFVVGAGESAVTYLGCTFPVTLGVSR